MSSMWLIWDGNESCDIDERHDWQTYTFASMKAITATVHLAFSALTSASTPKTCGSGIMVIP